MTSNPRRRTTKTPPTRHLSEYPYQVSKKLAKKLRQARVTEEQEWKSKNGPVIVKRGSAE